MSRTRIVLLLALLARSRRSRSSSPPGTEHFMMPAAVHFGLVSAAAAIASLASLALSFAGRAPATGAAS